MKIGLTSYIFTFFYKSIFYIKAPILSPIFGKKWKILVTFGRKRREHTSTKFMDFTDAILIDKRVFLEIIKYLCSPLKSNVYAFPF